MTQQMIMSSPPPVSRLEELPVLVTGGFGFMGSHLVRRLHHLGAKVALIVRSSTNPWRLHDLTPALYPYPADIRDPDEVMHCVKAIKPRIIFHLAAYGTNPEQDDRQEAMAINVHGTLNVLAAAQSCAVPRMVNVGSSSEYGNMPAPIREDAALQPLDIYGSSKAAATILAQQMAQDGPTTLITLRPFGVFGESEDPHKLFSYIILTTLKGGPVRLTTCEQYRDYCYVGNVVDGLLLAATVPQIQHNVFNIGTGQGRPLHDYIELIREALPTPPHILYGARAQRGRERLAPIPDIGRIQEQWGWNPRVSLEEGIEQTVRWFVHHQTQGPWHTH